MQKKHPFDLFTEMYREMKDEKLWGTFSFLNLPILIVKDLDIIKQIMGNQM
jgi:hypothetical protein